MSATVMMRVSFFFSIRVCLFVLCHLLLYLGPGKGDDLPLFDGIIVSSTCLLIIACTWGVWEAGQLFHARFCSPSFQSATTAVMPEQAAWFVWHYAHAMALIVFVFAYSILALSAHPPLTVCICIVASLLAHHHPSPSFFLHIVWLATMLLCLFLSMLDVSLHHNETSLFHILFFGFLLPAASVGLLHYLLPHIQRAQLTSYDLIKLTLPSLAMLSALFLSVTHTTTTRVVVNDTMSVAELERFYYAQGVDWLHSIASSPITSSSSITNWTNNTSSSNSSMLGHMLSQYLHTWQHPNATIFLTDTAPSALSVLATLLCPGILWLLLNIFLSSAHAMPQTKNNVTAFVFANLLRRLAFHGLGSWLRVFSFLLVVGASLITILYSYSLTKDADTSDEEQDDLIGGVHPTGEEPSMNDSMAVDTNAT